MQENSAVFGAEKFFMGILPYFLRKVFADEAENGDGKPPVVNFEDLVSKARKDEKDKVYPLVEELKKQNKVLTKANNEHLLTVAALEEQVKSLTEQLAKAGRGDPQEVLDLKKNLDDALKLVDGLRGELESRPQGTEDELRAAIEQEVEKRYEVKFYRLRKLQEAGDEILVPELVVGDTEEAVDASIAAAIEQTKTIKAKLGLDGTEKKKQGGGKNEEGGEPPKKPKPNPANPTGKGLNSLGDFDPAVIRNMTDEDYAEWRRKVGLGGKK